MDTLISLTAVITSQCICISRYNTVCYKYIQFLFANYTLIKLEKNKQYNKQYNTGFGSKINIKQFFITEKNLRRPSQYQYSTKAQMKDARVNYLQDILYQVASIKIPLKCIFKVA